MHAVSIILGLPFLAVGFISQWAASYVMAGWVIARELRK